MKIGYTVCLFLLIWPVFERRGFQVAAHIGNWNSRNQR